VNRLRFDALRDQFSTAALVLSVVALVAALAGGAIAANGSGGKATASAKGKRGPRGPKGATGPQGPQGPQGLPGANGKDGSNGANGSNGADGTSVTAGSFAGAGHGCTEGGILVKSASPEVGVCNGKKGTNGKSVIVGSESTGTANCGGNGGATVEVSGEPPTKQYVCNGEKGATGTYGGIELPSGVTETGYWAFSAPGGRPDAWVPISFTDRITPISFTSHYVPAGTANTDTVCGAGEGGAGGNANLPKAPPGVLCIFEFGPAGEYPVNAVFEGTYAQPAGLANPGGNQMNRTGAFMQFTTTTPADPASGAGSWALTG
jgi:hypothetical protein